MSVGAGVRAAIKQDWLGVISRHRNLLLRIALLAIPLAVMYAETLRMLAVTWWNDPDNSHGLLILPLAVYFAWRRRAQWLAAPLAPARKVGFATVLAGLVIFFVGRLGIEFFLTRFSLLVILAGLVLYFGGKRRLRIMAFPICLLLLAIPIPVLVFNLVALPLQSLASYSSAGVLDFCSVPVLRDGNVIHLANISLGVAEACSGIRSLMSLIALAVVIGYLKWPHLPQRIVLVLVAIPLAIALNITRVTGTAVIATYWNQEYAMGFFHQFSGWLVFVLAFLLLFGAASLTDRLMPARRRPEVEP